MFILNSQIGVSMKVNLNSPSFRASQKPAAESVASNSTTTEPNLPSDKVNQTVDMVRLTVSGVTSIALGAPAFCAGGLVCSTLATMATNPSLSLVVGGSAQLSPMAFAFAAIGGAVGLLGAFSAGKHLGNGAAKLWNLIQSESSTPPAPSQVEKPDLFSSPSSEFLLADQKLRL
jgi:hypothetical protein